MNRLTYIKGDLFTSSRRVIGHSVNCRGAFGSGVAGQVARLYPQARIAYLSKFKQEKWSLGEIQVVPVKNKIIVNMATQDTYGREGVHVDYNACFEAFEKLFRYAQMHWLDIALPKIGAGLAGGEWDRVETELLKALNNYETEVDIYYL